MKNLIYLIIVTPILFSCNTDKAVDLVQAKAEAEARAAEPTEPSISSFAPTESSAIFALEI